MTAPYKNDLTFFLTPLLLTIILNIYNVYVIWRILEFASFLSRLLLPIPHSFKYRIIKASAIWVLSCLSNSDNTHELWATAFLYLLISLKINTFFYLLSDMFWYKSQKINKFSKCYYFQKSLNWNVFYFLVII